jgi:hypothetical protein
MCCRMAGQLRPPPAHQPLPAHFNSATHIAMRPGKTHVESVLNLLDCRDRVAQSVAFCVVFCRVRDSYVCGRIEVCW